MQGVVLEHRDDAPGLQRPSDVADGDDRIWKAVETLSAPHQIERIVREWQPIERGGDELDPCTPILAGGLLLALGDVREYRCRLRRRFRPSPTFPR